MPTFIIFYKGQKIESVQGAVPAKLTVCIVNLSPRFFSLGLGAGSQRSRVRVRLSVFLLPSSFGRAYASFEFQADKLPFLSIYFSQAAIKGIPEKIASLSGETPAAAEAAPAPAAAAEPAKADDEKW